ncbi:MAG: hypothetical protein ACREBB_10075 [Nitrosotalea sp.]
MESVESSKWATRFIWSAVIQGGLVAIATLVLFVYGSVYLKPTPATVIASGSAGTWLLIGYMAYIIMIIALGVTALFYDYLEVRLGRKITRKKQSLLTMIHLVLMNVGITGSTWLLMYVGYVGGSAILPVSSGGGGLTDAQAHVQILAPFPPVIIGFIFATLVGVTSGGLAYLLELRSKHKIMFSQNDSMT